MRRKRRLLWIGGAAAVVALAAAWFFLPVQSTWQSLAGGEEGGGQEEAGGQEAGGQEAGGAGGRRSVAVETAEATAGRAEESFRTIGTIAAEERVELGAERAGRIREIAVEDGARVEQGEVILRFDDAAERAALQSAEAAAGEAETSLGRARELSEEGFVAEATVDERAAAAERARARLAEAREALADTVVRAPIAGELGILQVSPGDYVSAGQELVELVTSGRLRARFALPVEVAKTLETGQTVRLFPSEEDEAVLAAVDTIAPSADPQSRLVDVETVIAEAVAGMRPGAVVEVEVVTAVREDAVFVPETALQWEGPQAHLYRVGEDGRARRVGVEVGVRRNGRIELLDAAVEPGQRVVVEGVQKVRDGVAVTTGPPPGRSGEGEGGGDGGDEGAGGGG